MCEKCLLLVALTCRAIRPSAHTILLPTGQAFVKYDIGGFY